MGEADAGADDARFRAQRDVLEPVGSGHRRDAPVYRPDLLGCGASDQPRPGYRYTPQSIGAQILAVLDGLGLGKVHWVGESSGGIIGVLLAAAHPDRIASLVLCNTPTRIPDDVRRIYSLDQSSSSRHARARGRDVV